MLHSRCFALGTKKKPYSSISVDRENYSESLEFRELSPPTDQTASNDEKISIRKPLIEEVDKVEGSLEDSRIDDMVQLTTAVPTAQPPQETETEHGFHPNPFDLQRAKGKSWEYLINRRLNAGEICLGRRGKCLAIGVGYVCISSYFSLYNSQLNLTASCRLSSWSRSECHDRL